MQCNNAILLIIAQERYALQGQSISMSIMVTLSLTHKSLHF